MRYSSKSFEAHINTLDKVLSKLTLKSAGFNIHLAKSHFVRNKVAYQRNHILLEKSSISMICLNC